MSDEVLDGFSPTPDVEQHQEGGGEHQTTVSPSDAWKVELTALEQRLMKAIQSTKDKRIGRLEEQLQMQAEALRSQGYAVDADDIAAVRKSLVQQRLQESVQLGEEGSAQESSRPKPTKEAVKKVRLTAAELTTQYKFEIEEDDPEWKRLAALRTADPETYIVALRQEYKSKAARLGVKLPEPLAPETPGDADRVVSTVGGDVSDLKAQYWQEISKVPTGSEAALQIRRKYRLKGLTDF